MNNCCKEYTPTPITPVVECDQGCRVQTTTNCIIHKSTTESCLDFPSETTLDNVIKAIDSAFCDIVFADEMVKISATDTTSQYLIDKLVAGSNIKITRKNLGGAENLEISANIFNKDLINWGQCELCNNTMKICPDGFVYNSLTDKCKNLDCDCDSDTVIPEIVVFKAESIEQGFNKVLEYICCIKEEIDNITPAVPDLSGVNWNQCLPCKVDVQTPETIAEGFQEVINQLCCIDAKINPTPDNLKVFYVDGNNPNTGDGSILNPYKEIDDAVLAVIGTGSRAAPENLNVKIEVATFTYVVTTNLYVNTLTINFASGVVIRHEGTGYLIESLDSSATFQTFNITGGLNYHRYTAQGGFVNILNGKSLNIELNLIEDFIGNASTGIPVNKIETQATTGGFGASLTLNINKYIRSYKDTIFKVLGTSYLEINGKGSTKSSIIYGVYAGGTNTNTPITGFVIDYDNQMTSTPNNNIKVTDLEISTANGTVNVIKLRGNLRTNVFTVFKNLDFSGYGSSVIMPNIFVLDLNVDNDNFIIENTKVQNFSYVGAGLVITSTKMTKISLYNNNYPFGASINFLNLNFETTIGGARKVSVNIIDGKLTFTGIEQFLTIPGLPQGYRKNMIYKTEDGTLKIVL